MSRNAINDPKVQWEAGEGGATEEATQQVESLTLAYNEGARTLTQQGFNGEVLDIKPPHKKNGTE